MGKIYASLSMSTEVSWKDQIAFSNELNVESVQVLREAIQQAKSVDAKQPECLVESK